MRFAKIISKNNDQTRLHRTFPFLGDELWLLDEFQLNKIDFKGYVMSFETACGGVKCILLYRNKLT